MKCTGFDATSGAFVELSGGTVLESVEEQIAPPPAHGSFVAPGFIDIQVNGYAGVDFCDPKAPLEAIDHAIEVLLSKGVTRFFPTVITNSPEEILGALRNLVMARRGLRRGRAMEAIHVEGPHISPFDGPRGAHPKAWVRPPSIDEFERWQEAADGNVRLVTLSAEWPEAPRYIEHLAGQGVVVAIGHQQATQEQIEMAVQAGATLSTHLGNGAHQMLPRHPNYLWQQLAEDRLAASLIADGVHLGQDFLDVAIRAKGVERAVLITDAAMPTGCDPGNYRLGEVEVTLHAAEHGRPGRITLRDQDRLAASALSMDHGIENLMRLAHLSLRDAITMATRNPARVGRISGRKRGLQPGERSDVVEFSFDAKTKSISVIRTWLDGELVYGAEPRP
jgi:N-acetylglucosamine-6-phosphate deacetylase